MLRTNCSSGLGCSPSGRGPEGTSALSFTNVSANITASAALDGRPLLANADMSDLAFAAEGRWRLNYECSGDRLSVTPEVPGRSVSPMLFRRAS